MSEHVCKCFDCHPEAFPKVESGTPNYFDVQLQHPSEYPPWVTVDGVLVNQVFAALGGANGWAAFYPGRVPGDKRAHRCTCQAYCDCACADVKYGNVEFGPPKSARKTPEEEVAAEGQGG